MSEHHVYEFLALDAALSSKQMAELRAISTRAEITPSRFFNEYDWGDLNADPVELMRRYFDVHLYQFNWSTRRLMLRLPVHHADARALRQYLTTDSAQLRRSGRYLIVDVCSHLEGADWDEEEIAIASLVPMRSELMLGDFRMCYLAWLSSVQNGEVNEAAKEPNVPPGLASLTVAQEALANLLRLDPRLLRAAAQASPPLDNDSQRAKAWVKKLSQRDKNHWLERAISEPHLAVGGEMLAHFRKTAKPRRHAGTPARRVADILALAAASAKAPRSR